MRDRRRRPRILPRRVRLSQGLRQRRSPCLLSACFHHHPVPHNVLASGRQPDILERGWRRRSCAIATPRASLAPAFVLKAAPDSPMTSRASGLGPILAGRRRRDAYRGRTSPASPQEPGFAPLIPIDFVSADISATIIFTPAPGAAGGPLTLGGFAVARRRPSFVPCRSWTGAKPTNAASGDWPSFSPGGTRPPAPASSALFLMPSPTSAASIPPTSTASSSSPPGVITSPRPRSPRMLRPVRLSSPRPAACPARCSRPSS